MDKKRIPKLVIIPSEIESNKTFGISLHDNLVHCPDCDSSLCYITKKYGVVPEYFEFKVLGNRSKTTYQLREIAYIVCCAECGSFIDNNNVSFYNDDDIIYSYDELNDMDKIEVEYCLSQFNQKGDFTPQYDFPELKVLKEKLIEYEKNHPLQED